MKPAYSNKSEAKIKGHSSNHYGRQHLREISRTEQKPGLQERDRGKPALLLLRTKAGEDCPAYVKQCRHCGRRNHFAAVCKSKARNKSRDMPGASNKVKPNTDLVKKTTEEEMDSSDDEFISQAVDHLGTMKHV